MDVATYQFYADLIHYIDTIFSDVFKTTPPSLPQASLTVNTLNSLSFPRATPFIHLNYQYNICFCQQKQSQLPLLFFSKRELTSFPFVFWKSDKKFTKQSSSSLHCFRTTTSMTQTRPLRPRTADSATTSIGKKALVSALILRLPFIWDRIVIMTWDLLVFLVSIVVWLTSAVASNAGWGRTNAREEGTGNGMSGTRRSAKKRWTNITNNDNIFRSW